MDLSDIIRLRRTELKLTQENVAFELDCDPATYNRWEKNPEIMQMGKLKKLAEVLQTSVLTLLSSTTSYGVVSEPDEVYSLRSILEAKDNEINLYRQLVAAKESLLDKYREAEKRKKSQ